MAGVVSMSGLATGMDTKSLVSQLMALERQPELTLLGTKTKMQNQIDVYTPLQTAISTLQTLMSGMNTPATFAAQTSTVSDSTVLSSTASATASPGTHDLAVTTLAKSQRQVSANGFASTSDLNFNSGQFIIRGGTSDTVVTVAEGSNSLGGIAAAINSSGANVTASIINDGSSSPYRLVLSAKDTNNYTLDMSANATTSDGRTSTGLTTAPVQPNGGTTMTYSNPLFNYQTTATAATSNWYASSSTQNFKTGTFTLDGDPTHIINVTDTNNSLDGIAKAINDAKTSGLTSTSAAVIQDGNGYRLQLTKNGITSTDIDMSGLTGGTGTYTNPTFSNIDPTKAPTGDATYSAGTNASFTLDGISMTKSTNAVSDVLTGVTFNLLKGGTTDATTGKTTAATSVLTISNDTATITSKINSFVSSYNDIIGIINKQSVYDTTAKTSAPLFGDSTLRSVKEAMRSIISSPVTDAVDGTVNKDFSLLSKIGISTNSKDGTLSVDSTLLTTALNTNFTAVTDLFTHNGGKLGITDNTQLGIAERFNQMLAKYTAPYIGSGGDNGIIATRINGLQQSMTNVDDQAAKMELLLTQKEDNLNKQFAAMETLVSKLTNSGNAMLSSLSGMPKWG